MSVASFLSNLETLGYRAAGKFPDKDLAKLEEIAKLVAQNGAITLSGKQLTRESSEIYRPMARAYKQIMAELPPGKSVADAHKDFMKAMKDNDLFGKGTEVSTNQRAFTKFLADQTVVTERQVERAINGAPKSGLREEVTLTRLEQKALDAAKAKAESVISNSVLDMSTVRMTNGKMPKQAFFSELQDALRAKNLLTINPEAGRTLLTTPNEVFERISQRRSVTEKEVAILSEYFGRFHNDAKMAAKEAQTPPATNNIMGKSGAAAVIDNIARRIPVSDGGRTSPTLAQNHAWTTGGTSFWLNRATSFQERPFRTLASYAATAFTAYAAQQTISTYTGFENPNFIGREVIGILTADKNKDAHDFVEFVHSRLNTDAPRALENLKKFYGIEKFDDSNGTEVVEALLRGPKPPYNPSPDVTQSLIMFVSQKVYGKVVTSTADLKNEQNEQKKRANDSIDRDADTDKAKAGQKEQAIADLKQAARTAGAPEDLLGGLGDGANKKSTPQSSGETPHEATSFASTLTGDVFKQRLDSMKQEGLLSDELHSKLASAFKGATKAPVSDNQEFTRANVAKGAEISSFAKNAAEILSQNQAIPKSAINQAVYELLAPAAP
jgi:hypothetical protein